jgi:hypothetical protein
MHSVKVEVRGELKLERTFWEDASEADKDNYPGVITPEQCVWSLDDEVDDDGEDIKLLMITLVKRPVTDEEREWKKGKRMDNQDKKRIDRRNAKVGVHSRPADPTLMITLRRPSEPMTRNSHSHASRRDF